MTISLLSTSSVRAGALAGSMSTADIEATIMSAIAKCEEHQLRLLEIPALKVCFSSHICNLMVLLAERGQRQCQVGS